MIFYRACPEHLNELTETEEGDLMCPFGHPVESFIVKSDSGLRIGTAWVEKRGMLVGNEEEGQRKVRSEMDDEAQAELRDSSRKARSGRAHGSILGRAWDESSGEDSIRRDVQKNSKAEAIDREDQ